MESKSISKFIIISAGSTGIDVVFPNTAVGTSTVDAGGALGAGSVPVVAGTITYVTLVAN